MDVAAFDRDRASAVVADRIRRDLDSGLATGQVLGTPTLFIDDAVHRGGYDPPALLAAGPVSRPPAGRAALGRRTFSEGGPPPARPRAGWRRPEA